MIVCMGNIVPVCNPCGAEENQNARRGTSEFVSCDVEALTA